MIDIANPTTPSEIKKATDDAIKEIEKTHGEGSIVRMNEAVGREMPHIPTGVYSVDHHVLDIGGLPKGRIIEIFGPESAGKTSLALAAIGSAQRQGLQAAFIDVEHSLDPNWATLHGVDMKNLLVSQPNWGEQAMQIVEVLVASGAFGIIVVDSVAALVPKSELDGEIGDASMGTQARLMSQSMRKLTGAVSKTDTILVFLNQIRMKIGVMFGSPETTPGGRALVFYSSVRLDVRRSTAIKEGEQVIGNTVKIKAVKNKTGLPYQECLVDLLFASGFDNVGPILDAAVDKALAEKSGAWYSYKGTRIGQGRANTIAFLKNNKEILAEMTSAIGGK